MVGKIFVHMRNNNLLNTWSFVVRNLKIYKTPI